MKKVLLLMVAVLMVSSVAMAAPHYGVYTDCNGTSCLLTPGFSSAIAVVEKFSVGTTGCRFKVDVSGAPGTSIFGFNTTFVPIGQVGSDLSLGYGGCFTGTTCLGTMIIQLAAGTLSVVAAEGFPTIIYTDCSFGEYIGHGGIAHVGSGDPLDCGEIATEQSTWGSVKALYR